MTPQRPGRPGERAFALLLLLFSLFLLWQAYGIAGFRSVSSAGVFPMLAATTMVVTIAVVVWRTRGAEGEGLRARATRFVREVLPWRLVAFVGLILAYMLALEPLGFLISSAGFLVVALLLLWRRNILVVVPVAAGSLGVVYALFHWLFRVVLP